MKSAVCTLKIATRVQNETRRIISFLLSGSVLDFRVVCGFLSRGTATESSEDWKKTGGLRTIIVMLVRSSSKFGHLALIKERCCIRVCVVSLMTVE